MKFTLCFKTPDVLDQIPKPSLCEECQINHKELKLTTEDYPFPGDCKECQAKEKEYIEARDTVDPFLEYGEYVSIEVDS